MPPRHLPLFGILRLCFAALVGAICVALPNMARADPSCGLEDWLTSLNDSANSYVAALGSASEHEAARQFRTEMERYDRDRLLKQIREADLGQNEKALMDYISSRRHLLDLHAGNWPEMAERYGSDPRFGAQASNLERYLTAVPCDPTAPDHLNAAEEDEQSFMARLTGGVDEMISLLSPEEKAEHTPEPVDPTNFDEFRPQTSPAQEKNTVALSPSGNVAFVLGIFTFITAITSWVWMRYGIVQRRAIRYPCSLPVIVFDGIVPVIGEYLDISQIGAKIETDLNLSIRQKIKLTCGPVERKAKVIWRNNHFVGVKFDRSLSELEMRSLLGPYAAQIAAEREEARQMGLDIPLSSYAPEGTKPAVKLDAVQQDTERSDEEAFEPDEPVPDREDIETARQEPPEAAA